jgi:hypothetical protein
MVCLFEELEEAMAFDKAVATRRMLIPNREDIFGEQLLMDHEDGVLGKEEYLLTPATTLSLEEAFSLVKEYDGICYPAHIDRSSNSVSSVLGAFPDYLGFKFAEVHDSSKLNEYSLFSGLSVENLVVSSDAHYLWDINEKNSFFTLDADQNDSEAIVKSLFKKLRGQV